MNISVIIPVWNEAGTIGTTLQFLKKYSPACQILVVDGNSNDATCEIVESFKDVILLRSPQKGRAAQMNFGAQKANGEILYFLHADAKPPLNFTEQILAAVQEGAKAGCFRFKFDSRAWMLKINSWFTRLPYLWCRGGDQSLFITSSTFKEFNGFNEEFEVMEEYDLIVRIQEKMTFVILKDEVLVSARKYSTNSWFKVMKANFVAFRQFKKGVSTSIIKQTYKSNLNPYL